MDKKNYDQLVLMFKTATGITVNPNDPSTVALVLQFANAQWLYELKLEVARLREQAQILAMKR